MGPVPDNTASPSPADLPGKIGPALTRGLDLIRRRQKPSGEIPVYCGVTYKGQHKLVLDKCIFPTSLSVECLLALGDSAPTGDIVARATQFLLDEVHHYGLWSYFTREHGLRNVCTSDADDTACVSVVLQATGHADALIPNKRLLLANRNRKGLFYTFFITRLCLNFDPLWWRVALSEWRYPRSNVRYWLSIKCKRNAVDAVVNANVLYYLGDIPETRPVVDLLVRIIETHEETRCDYWYHKPNIIYYFLARLFRLRIARLEPIRQPLIDRIRASLQPDGRLGETVLETAMATSALINLGVPAGETVSSIRFLLQAQGAEGEWPRTPLYDGGEGQGLTWGSDELTTAFCLEALARFRPALALAGKT